MKQVVGVKLQLKDAIGFAKPGVSADGEVLVEWRFLAGEDARKMIAVARGSYGEGWPPSSGAAIRVQNLWKKYSDTEAVRGISFDVNKGDKSFAGR